MAYSVVRADEGCYDPVDKLAAFVNNADDPPFVTFISTTDRRAVGKIVYEDATDGVEQPVYEPRSGMFYISVPETKAEPGGRIDPADVETEWTARRRDARQLDECHLAVHRILGLAI